jgi:ABC-type dipeptide/oligopeptide/nickel transport system, ATPase component
MNNLLQVKNLNIVFRSAHGEHRAVRDVSFHVGREKVAIVGESGSGKSQTCRALLQLTPKIGRVTADQMQFGDMICSTAVKNRCARFAEIVFQ